MRASADLHQAAKAELAITQCSCLHLYSGTARLAGASAALSQHVVSGISSSRMAKQGARALLASAGQGERDADVQVTGAVPFDSFPLRGALHFPLSTPKASADLFMGEGQQELHRHASA